jgi:Leucine-rich repeat (LRR) protein
MAYYFTVLDYTDFFLLCRLSNLTTFSHLGGLTFLDISRNHLSDLSALSCLSNLRELYADYNQITSLSPIGDLQHLTKVSMRGNVLKDVHFFSDGTSSSNEMPELKELYIAENRITSLSGLKNCPNLEILDVCQNELKDLHKFMRVLRRLKKLQVLDSR